MKITTKETDGKTSAIFVGIMIALIILISLTLPSLALYLVLNAFGVKIGFWISVCIVFLFYFTLLSLREIFG